MRIRKNTSMPCCWLLHTDAVSCSSADRNRPATHQAGCCCREDAEAVQRAVHERLVFELLGIRERFSGSTTRRALDAYQDHRPQPPGEQDSAPMHKAPVRCA